MRRIIGILLATLAVVGCGTSSGLSTGTGDGRLLVLGGGGNFIETTVEVERRFLYVLNRGDNSVSGYVIPDEDDDEHGHGHGHGHGHSHRALSTAPSNILLQSHDHHHGDDDHDDDHHDHDHDHDDDHHHGDDHHDDDHHDHDHDHDDDHHHGDDHHDDDHHDHDHDHDDDHHHGDDDHDHDHDDDHHDHEHGDDHDGEVEFVELDGSPFRFGSQTLLDMVVDPTGHRLILLDSSGSLRSYRIDGFRGFLFLEEEIQSGVASARKLVLSEDGSTVGVLGANLALVQLGDQGQFLSSSLITDTASWIDLAIRDASTGAATVEAGVVGFQKVGPDGSPVRFALDLPGSTRGQLLYREDLLYVLNSSDRSLSLLDQAEDGTLELRETVSLPSRLTNPRFLALVHEGEDLVVADSNTLVLFHIHDGELEEEGHLELIRTITGLFAVPESEVLLVSHQGGIGTTSVLVEDHELEVLDSQGPGGTGVSAFGFAERTVLHTESMSL